MHIALYQPDIPPNTGTIIRMAACLDVGVHIIEPCGFPFDMNRVKRSAMDYIDHVKITRHNDFASFYEAQFPAKEYLGTTSFVVPEKLSRLPDLLYIHATENNTQIFINNQYVKTINKNQQWDTTFDEPIKVQGSNPIFVTQYFFSRHFVSDTINPEMMIAYPIKYRTSNFNFFLN